MELRVDVFDDLKEEYNNPEVREKLEGLEFPLYFMVTNGKADSVNITDPFVDNLKIGTTKLDYDTMQFIATIDPETPAGNIAIEIASDLQTHDGEEGISFKKQVGVIFYNVEVPTFQLLIGLGDLGTLQEDMFSVYFTGKTIRTYNESVEETAVEEVED